MLRFLFYGLLIYLLYKLVFELIIPVYKTTRKIKKSFREMHSRMQEQSYDFAGNGKQQNSAQPSAAKPANKREDYIDFEEVK
jgi:hypothetical protein